MYAVLNNYIKLKGIFAFWNKLYPSLKHMFSLIVDSFFNTIKNYSRYCKNLVT